MFEDERVYVLDCYWKSWVRIGLDVRYGAVEESGLSRCVVSAEYAGSNPVCPVSLFGWWLVLVCWLGLGVSEMVERRVGVAAGFSFTIKRRRLSI